jgi:hypothetical protein
MVWSGDADRHRERMSLSRHLTATCELDFYEIVQLRDQKDEEGERGDRPE